MRTNIGVLGSRDTSDGNIAVARHLGEEIAGAGAVLICGGYSGVMGAAAEGCRSQGGLAIGILPVLDRKGCSPDLEVAIPTSMGFGRNMLVASASDCVIAVGGNYGTLSEIAFALNYGRPVVVIKNTGGTADFMAGSPYDNVHVAEDAKEAVSCALSLVEEKSRCLDKDESP